MDDHAVAVADQAMAGRAIDVEALLAALEQRHGHRRRRDGLFVARYDAVWGQSRPILRLLPVGQFVRQALALIGHVVAGGKSDRQGGEKDRRPHRHAAASSIRSAPWASKTCRIDS